MDDIKNQVIGIDEVGRGAFCGPVVSCSILLEKKILNNSLVFQITDSKKLSHKKRSILSKFIKEYSSYSIGVANNIEIDEMNILNATHLAMKRAINNIQIKPEKILIDGKYVPSGLLNAEAFIGGDKLHQQIMLLMVQLQDC